MAKTIDEFKKDIPLLVEAGLVAIKQGDEQNAKKLFEAVAILDPQNSMPKIGYGLICMHKMQLDDAQKHFEEVIRNEPDNYRAQAFLGLCLILSTTQDKTKKEQKLKNLERGAELATKIVNDKDAPDSSKQLAQSLLDWEKEMQEKTFSGPIR